jgi:hypothetical protein
MAEITTASAEQSSGIEQVSKAIAQMDEVTQRNAALVEEEASTADALQNQAAQLAQTVAVFRLNDISVTPHYVTAANMEALPLSRPERRPEQRRLAAA